MSTVVEVPPGVVCSVDEYNLSDAVLPTFFLHCLTRGQTIGLMVVTGSGLVSFIAVVCMFVVIFRNARFYRKQRQEAGTGSYYSLIEKPIDVLLLSLFLADLIQAIGALFVIEWVKRGKTEIGGFCTSQGVVQQLGETAVAMTTTVIALYTLSSWYRGSEGSLRVAVYVVLGIWALDWLLIIIGNAHYHSMDNPYSTPTPYWCWISQGHTVYQIVGEYVWFWIALVVSVVVYIIMAVQDDGLHKHQILAYPLVYAITILPLSAVRFVGFSREQQPLEQRKPVPSVATFVVISIYGLSGFFNVVLTYWTREQANLLHRKKLADVPVDVGIMMPNGYQADGAEHVGEVLMLQVPTHSRYGTEVGGESPREGSSEVKINIT